MQDDAVGAKWHPAKLEQALEQLEAERQRRISEKIEGGTAVGYVEFMNRADEPPRDLGRDEKGPERVRILRVFTGVPRGEVEATAPTASAEPRTVAAERPKPTESWVPSRYNYGPLETAAPKPAPRFEPMEKPRAVKVQTEAPSNGSMGAVEWFAYTIDRDGKMTVSDRNGVTVGATIVAPGSELGESSFWRRLN